MGKQVIDTNVAHVELREDGICHVTIFPKIHIDLRAAQEIVAARLQVTQGKSTPLFVDIREIHSGTREARSYSRNAGIGNIAAMALLVRSPVSKVLGNLFLHFTRPPFPTRLFSSQDEAFLWLKEYVIPEREDAA